MQPLGGKTRKGQEGRKGFWKRGASSDKTGRAGIFLSLTENWKGWSQKPGRVRSRARATFMLPLSWKAGVGVFFAAAAFYGLSEGGYVSRTVQFANEQLASVVAHAGFAVSSVTIEGQERTSNAAIVSALGIDKNTSTLAFDTAAAQDRLEKLPLVRRAQVMRLLPSQLHVVIEERVPYAVWQHNSLLRLVDHDGTVIDTVTENIFPDLPLIVGEGAAEHARDLLDELAHWPDVKAKIQAAVRVADRRWNLKLLNGLEVRLPENDAGQALKKLAELDRSQKILSGDAITVDLRLADRVTVRLGRETAQARDSAYAKPERKPRQLGQDT